MLPLRTCQPFVLQQELHALWWNDEDATYWVICKNQTWSKWLVCPLPNNLQTRCFNFALKQTTMRSNRKWRDLNSQLHKSNGLRPLVNHWHHFLFLFTRLGFFLHGLGCHAQALTVPTKFSWKLRLLPLMDCTSHGNGNRCPQLPPRRHLQQTLSGCTIGVHWHVNMAFSLYLKS